MVPRLFLAALTSLPEPMEVIGNWRDQGGNVPAIVNKVIFYDEKFDAANLVQMKAADFLSQC